MAEATSAHCTAAGRHARLIAQKVGNALALAAIDFGCFDHADFIGNVLLGALIERCGDHDAVQLAEHGYFGDAGFRMACARADQHGGDAGGGEFGHGGFQGS